MTTEQLVLQALSNILTTTKKSDNTPAFALVDEFMGQYLDEEGNPLWTCPAALIELSDIDWEEDNLYLPQSGLLRFKVHFVFDTGYDNIKRRLNTEHNNIMSQGVKSLRHKLVSLSDLGADVDNVLMNRIRRTRTQFIQNLTETVVTVVEFETVVVDYSMLPEWTEVIVPIETQLYVVKDEADFKIKVK